MTTTTTERPKMDTDLLAEEAESVRRTLSGSHDDLMLVKDATSIVDEDDQLYDELGRYREDLILSLVFYDGRSALAVADLAGLSRSMVSKIIDKRVGGGQKFHLSTRVPVTTEDGRTRVGLTPKSSEELAEAARKAKVRKRSKAADELAEVSEKIMRSRERGRVAREIRNDALRRLVADGKLNQAEAARLIGTNHTNITHIMTRRGGKQ